MGKRLLKAVGILIVVLLAMIVLVRVGSAFLGEIISGLIMPAATEGAKGLTQGGIGGLFQGIWNGLSGQVSKSGADIGAIASQIVIFLCQWVSSVLQAANNLISSYIFGDLLILIDYQKIPQVGDYVTRFYGVMKAIGISLAGFFFLFTTGTIAIRSLARGAWKDSLQVIGKLLMVLICIQLFPTLFSLSISLVSNITSSIMDEKVAGETIKHAPKDQLTGGNSSIIAGIDQIANDIDYVMNLPDNLLKEGKQVLNQAENSAITYLEDQSGKLLGEAAGGIKYTGLQSMVKGVIGKAVTGQGNGIEALIPQNLLNAGLNIIVAIISLTSLILLLALFGMKGVQITYLMALFMLAPLAFAFDALPQKKDQILNFLGLVWAVMAWNIVWAVFIKIYFISNLMVNVINAASASSQLTQGVKGAIPLAGIFLRLGIITLMDSVSVWVTVIGFRTISAAGKGFFQQVSMLPRAVGAASSGISSAIGGAVGAAAGGLAVAGAATAMLERPKDVMHGLAGMPGSVVGQAAYHFSRGHFNVHQQMNQSLNAMRNQSEGLPPAADQGKKALSGEKMISKLEQKILIFGYTVAQGLGLVVATMLYLMIFSAVMGMFGLVAALVLGLFFIGTPAILFKTMHGLPERFFENWIYFHFLKPDIYLPGRNEGQDHGKQ